MMKRALMTIVAVAALGVAMVTIPGSQKVSGHCQVPCGIYDDEARIKSMLEDTETITKAINELGKLVESHSVQDVNQAVRWINTKEDHAAHIIEVVSLYFLTQKVAGVESGADGYEEYLKKLSDHHAVMRAAMKTKQTVDPKAAEALRAAIMKLSEHYHSH
jgi:nickel superoxide dismutase